MDRAIAMLLFAAIPLLHVQCARDIHPQFRTHGFPTTAGTVTVSHVDHVPGSWKATWLFEYEYAVGDGTYIGTRKSELSPQRSVKRFAAEGEAKLYPVGSTVRVYYDPADPANARLVPGVTNGTPAIAWLLLLLQLPVLAVAAGLIDASRYGTDFNPTDPRHVATLKDRTVVRPPSQSRGALFLAAGGWFGATLLVLLVFGIHLPDLRSDPLLLDRFGLRFGAGLAAAVVGLQGAYVWRVLARPKIVLDTRARRIAYYSRWEPWPTFELPFAAVNWVQTVPIPMPLQNKPTPLYQVQLGHEHPTVRVLAEFADWRDADALAARVWSQVGGDRPRDEPA